MMIGRYLMNIKDIIFKVWFVNSKLKMIDYIMYVYVYVLFLFKL